MLTRKIGVSAGLGLALLVFLSPAAPAPTGHSAATGHKATVKHALRKHTRRKPVSPARKPSVVPIHKSAKSVRRPTPLTNRTHLKTAVPPVAAPIAPRPVTPLVVVRGPRTGERNIPYSVGGAQLTFQGGEVTDKSLPNLFGNIPPDAGTHYVLFTMSVKNTGAVPLDWSFERFNPKLETANSGDTIVRGTALLTGKNAKFETQPIQPGEEKMVRFHFQVPIAAMPKTLSLSSDGNEYRFDVSDVR